MQAIEIVCFLSERDGEIKCAAFIYFALHPNPSPMCFNQVTGDSQSKTGTAGGPRPIHFIEALEDTR